MKEMATQQTWLILTSWNLEYIYTSKYAWNEPRKKRIREDFVIFICQGLH